MISLRSVGTVRLGKIVVIHEHEMQMALPGAVGEAIFKSEYTVGKLTSRCVGWPPQNFCFPPAFGHNIAVFARHAWKTHFFAPCLCMSFKNSTPVSRKKVATKNLRRQLVATRRKLSNCLLRFLNDQPQRKLESSPWVSEITMFVYEIWWTNSLFSNNYLTSSYRYSIYQKYWDIYCNKIGWM